METLGVILLLGEQFVDLLGDYLPLCLIGAIWLAGIGYSIRYPEKFE